MGLWRTTEHENEKRVSLWYKPSWKAMAWRSGTLREDRNPA